MMSLKIDMGELNSLLKIHLDNKTQELETGLKSSLDSPIFSWGSQTHRKNGDVVTDPRNAIDTGELQKSINTENGKGLSNKIKFNVEYAGLVIEHSSVDFVDFTTQRIGN